MHETMFTEKVNRTIVRSRSHTLIYLRTIYVTRTHASQRNCITYKRNATTAPAAAAPLHYDLCVKPRMHPYWKKCVIRPMRKLRTVSYSREPTPLTEAIK